MKRALSILLLLVFLFNVGGYYIVFWGLRFQMDQQLTSRLDANSYDPEATIELKIPLALPYPVQSNGFQRVDGRFERNGEFFRLVKQKLEGDTLYIVCIRDRATRELVNTMTDYIRLTQGVRASDTGQKALTYLGNVIKDLFFQRMITVTCPVGCDMEVAFVQRRDLFLQVVMPVQAPPPKG